VGTRPRRQARLDIQDLATYEAPHQYARGIEWVLVNGRVVIEGGQHTGALPGQVLSPA